MTWENDDINGVLMCGILNINDDWHNNDDINSIIINIYVCNTNYVMYMWHNICICIYIYMSHGMYFS